MRKRKRDQVERLDVERGEMEWELQTIYARAVDAEASAQAFTVSFSTTGASS